jgi:hypothetical protein
MAASSCRRLADPNDRKISSGQYNLYRENTLQLWEWFLPLIRRHKSRNRHKSTGTYVDLGVN